MAWKSGELLPKTCLSKGQIYSAEGLIAGQESMFPKCGDACISVFEVLIDATCSDRVFGTLYCCQSIRYADLERRTGSDIRSMR